MTRDAWTTIAEDLEIPCVCPSDCQCAGRIAAALRAAHRQGLGRQAPSERVKEGLVFIAARAEADIASDPLRFRGQRRVLDAAIAWMREVSK